MQSECAMPQLKELEQLKLSSSAKVLLLINLSQKTYEKSVSNVEITMPKYKQLVKSKVTSINYSYFANVLEFLY